MLSIYLSMVETDEEKSLVEELYIKYEQAMYRTAFSILHNKHLSEDAVHTAFVRVIKYLEKISSIPGNKRGYYLIIIVKNVSLAMMKEQNKYDDSKDISGFYDIEAPDSVEDEALSDISLQALVNALHELPDIYYEPLYLKLVLDVSISEISDLLGINPNTVRQRIYKAKMKLRKIWGEKYAE